MEQSDSTITRIEKLGSDIVRMTVQAPTIASQAKPGQFVSIRAGVGYDPLLRRPFSIHQVNADSTLQILFKVIGKGTSQLAEQAVGASVNLMGPLGNHFTPGAAMCLVGGGLGIAPLLFLAQTLLRQDPQPAMVIILGARNRDELIALTSGFQSLDVTLHLTTDDGSIGHHGLVTDLMPGLLSQQDGWQVRSCGPYPMLRAVAALSRKHGWQCQVSLETMMACGISACLGCTVEASANHRKGGPYLHVCKDGPVFDEGEIAWK